MIGGKGSVVYPKLKTNIFSLMNYLEFVYEQPLLGVIEESKNNLRAVLNFYFHSFADAIKDSELKDMLSHLEKKHKIATEITKPHFKIIKKFKTKRFFGKVNHYPLVIKELNFLRDLAVSLDKVWLPEAGEAEIQKIIDDGANKKDFYKKFIAQLPNIKSNALADFENFFKAESEYSKLENFNIAVCATMSAGKSTLVNALLGSDFLPTRNEATTAKITSVYDKDGLALLRGICQKSLSKEFVFDIDGKTIDEWNSSSEVKHIYLQGDLDGIKNTDKFAVAVHDTPGTNNSQDTVHNKITMDFLQKENIDAVIYVANFEHLLTIDESILLKELASKVVNVKNIPVIFAVNKVDNYDKEKESYSETMQKFTLYVESVGFKNFGIVPVAAKPARLFKMALKGKSENFTESECDIFSSFMNKFTKRININELGKNPASMNDLQNYADASKIEVDGEKYEIASVRQALLNTGLIALEKQIENTIANN